MSTWNKYNENLVRKWSSMSKTYSTIFRCILSRQNTYTDFSDPMTEKVMHISNRLKSCESQSDSEEE